jgi:hypothetical protein
MKKKSGMGLAQSNDAFVKKVQAKIASKMSVAPKGRMNKTDAYMTNNGETAAMASKKLTATIDSEFPVK